MCFCILTYPNKTWSYGYRLDKPFPRATDEVQPGANWIKWETLDETALGTQKWSRGLAKKRTRKRTSKREDTDVIKDDDEREHGGSGLCEAIMNPLIRKCESHFPAERQLSPENESESGRLKPFQLPGRNCWIRLIPHALFWCLTRASLLESSNFYAR